MTADVLTFPDRAQRDTITVARRLERAAQNRHDWVAEHRDEFVRIARLAARDAIATRDRGL